MKQILIRGLLFMVYSTEISIIVNWMTKFQKQFKKYRFFAINSLKTKFLKPDRV